jgi:hypothetical protein
LEGTENVIMKKVNLFLLALVFAPCFSFSQQWKQYSDSVIVYFKKNDIVKASNFIELADIDLAKSKIIRDTLYADYMYRKGVVNYEKGDFNSLLFEESLSIWELTKKKNYTKIMKNHYFLAVGYHRNLNYLKAYGHYEKCYLINKANKLPWNYNFSQSIYFLSVIDYNTNLNYKKAEQYAQEYIELNKEVAMSNYDFLYAYAYKWMDDIDGFAAVLLQFKKKYDNEKLNNPTLYFEINYKLLGYYYDNYKSKECIYYGEKSLEYYFISKLDKKKYLNDLYQILAWAYSEINDKQNKIKYENLIKK